MDCSPPGSTLREFSRQEYWIELPFPPPWDLPNPGTEPTSLMSPALAGVFFTTSTTWEANCFYIYMDFPGSSAGKESACNAGDLSSFLGGKILWIRDRLPTPVFLGFPGGSAAKNPPAIQEVLEMQV